MKKTKQEGASIYGREQNGCEQNGSKNRREQDSSKNKPIMPWMEIVEFVLNSEKDFDEWVKYTPIGQFNDWYFYLSTLPYDIKKGKVHNALVILDKAIRMKKQKQNEMLKGARLTEPKETVIDDIRNYVVPGERKGKNLTKYDLDEMMEKAKCMLNRDAYEHDGKVTLGVRPPIKMKKKRAKGS